MFVKLKNPAQVFFDREQKVTLNGAKAFEVKATGHIRALLNVKSISEVSADEAKKINLALAKKVEAATVKKIADTKDLETKVEELEGQAEVKESENLELKAKVKELEDQAVLDAETIKAKDEAVNTAGKKDSSKENTKAPVNEKA